jgi:hypothetical protein
MTVDGVVIGRLRPARELARLRWLGLDSRGFGETRR